MSNQDEITTLYDYINKHIRRLLAEQLAGPQGDRDSYDYDDGYINGQLFAWNQIKDELIDERMRRLEGGAV